MKQRLLITGATGFLGTNAVRFFAGSYHVLAHWRRTPLCIANTSAVQFDLTSERQIKSSAQQCAVDAVIHLAAVTSPDACADDPSYARRINVSGTQHLINYYNDQNIPIIFASTDLVFDGKQGMYSESDELNPVNLYGETKAQGEELVLAGLESNIVMRIALSYGKSFPGAGGGYLDHLLERLAENDMQHLYTDQYRSPLYSGDFCRAVEAILGKIFDQAQPMSRLYHIAGSERVSRYDFGKAVIAMHKKPAHLISPSTMKQAAMRTPRGGDCSLSISRAVDELGYTPGTITENLQHDLSQRKEEANHADFGSY